MESSELVTTNRKALRINLDEPKYGTFAEIGAGQEVARHFFQAGGAAGTVAKSLSAYDMKFSDAFYGKSARYVSRERLELMLNREYDLLVQRLGGDAGRAHGVFRVLRHGGRQKFQRDQRMPWLDGGSLSDGATRADQRYHPACPNVG